MDDLPDATDPLEPQTPQTPQPTSDSRESTANSSNDGPNALEHGENDKDTDNVHKIIEDTSTVASTSTSPLASSAFYSLRRKTRSRTPATRSELQDEAGDNEKAETDEAENDKGDSDQSPQATPGKLVERRRSSRRLSQGERSPGPPIETQRSNENGRRVNTKRRRSSRGRGTEPSDGAKVTDDGKHNDNQDNGSESDHDAGRSASAKKRNLTKSKSKAKRGKAQKPKPARKRAGDSAKKGGGKTMKAKGNQSKTKPRAKAKPAQKRKAVKSGGEGKPKAQKREKKERKPGKYDGMSEELKALGKLKQKPAQFQKITRNQYAFTITSRLAPEKCSCEVTNDEPGCLDSCINRHMFVECEHKLCPCGRQCQNRRFQKKMYAKHKVHYMGPKGFGLLAAEKISKGSFIIEYCGEVLNDAQTKERLKEYSGASNFYLLTLTQSETIDATKKGALARFINHSCHPNAESQKWQVNGQMRMGLFAKRDIDKWQEISFDYQFQRFGVKKQRCYCGASNCRGFLGAKPLKFDGSDGDVSEAEAALLSSQAQDLDYQGEVDCVTTQLFDSLLPFPQASTEAFVWPPVPPEPVVAPFSAHSVDPLAAPPATELGAETNTTPVDNTATGSFRRSTRVRLKSAEQARRQKAAEQAKAAAEKAERAKSGKEGQEEEGEEEKEEEDGEPIVNDEETFTKLRPKDTDNPAWLVRTILRAQRQRQRHFWRLLGHPTAQDLLQKHHKLLQGPEGAADIDKDEASDKDT